MVRIRFVSLIRFVAFAGCGFLAGQLLAADPAATTLYSTDALQGTKSVMVRHSGAATAAATASPVRKVDKAVQPASANEPLGALAAADGVDTAAAAASLAASDLLNHALEAFQNGSARRSYVDAPASDHSLRREPKFPTRHRPAYWKLSAAEGDYNWAVDEADQLDHIAAGTTATDATVIATARASSQARLLEAKLSAVTAQQELADLLSIPPNNPLPLTADPPLVGAYRTYFDTLYSGRVPPPRMRLIDRTLPIRREAIETHVAAVQAAASAVHSAEDARAKGTSDLQNLLLCEADLSRQRRSFLMAVRDYNYDIDEYALTVAEPNVPTDRVIGMLIRTKPAAAPTIAPPPSSTVAPPASSEPTIVRPSPGDPLLQPALPPGTAGRPRQQVVPAADAATPPASPTSPATSPPSFVPPAPHNSVGPFRLPQLRRRLRRQAPTRHRRRPLSPPPRRENDEWRMTNA